MRKVGRTGFRSVLPPCCLRGGEPDDDGADDLSGRAGTAPRLDDGFVRGGGRAGSGNAAGPGTAMAVPTALSLPPMHFMDTLGKANWVNAGPPSGR